MTDEDRRKTDALHLAFGAPGHVCVNAACEQYEKPPRLSGAMYVWRHGGMVRTWKCGTCGLTLQDRRC